MFTRAANPETLIQRNNLLHNKAENKDHIIMPNCKSILHFYLFFFKTDFISDRMWKLIYTQKTTPFKLLQIITSKVTETL